MDILHSRNVNSQLYQVGFCYNTTMKQYPNLGSQETTFAVES